jgi:hypothetical protein
MRGARRILNFVIPPSASLREAFLADLSSIHKPPFGTAFLLLNRSSILKNFVTLAGPFIIRGNSFFNPHVSVYVATPRIKIAAGYPTLPVTMFNIQCMPYVKYTYQWPAGPNIGAFRFVRPREACEALSRGPSYASTSVIIPEIVLRPTRRTRYFPSSCRVT